ncbi:MAG: 4Fe-4S binding protein [Pseudomonadota bacterium]
MDTKNGSKKRPEGGIKQKAHREEAKGSGVEEEKKPRRYYQQVIFRDWCKACGICIAFCPKEVLGRSKNGEPVIEHPEECTGCRFCELHCPDFAINILDRNKREGERPSHGQ